MTPVIIFGSVAMTIAIISALLLWFVRKSLHNDKDRLALWIVGLLTLQFVFGMLANLFVKIPDIAPYDVWHHPGPVAFHTLNALLLIILSIIFLIRSIKSRSSRSLAAIALLSILISTYAGVTFILTGQPDGYSFVMSLGFIAAFLLYSYQGFSSLRINKDRHAKPKPTDFPNVKDQF